MKRNYLYKLIGLMVTLSNVLPSGVERNKGLYAQAPQGINYQAVARDTAGTPLKMKSLGVEFKIIRGSSAGPPVYTETHNKTTNEFGLFTAEIGKGTFVSGVAFNAIPWSEDSFWLEVLIDTSPPGTFLSMGTMQFFSVPYALQAEKADSLSGVLPIANGGTNNTTAYTGGSVLFYDGAKITENNAGFFWDNTKNSLGIGIKPLLAKLDIAQTSTVTALRAIHSGSAGNAAIFTTSNTSNGFTALVASSNGTGNAGSFQANGTSGNAANFQITNPANTIDAVFVSTLGTGNALRVQTTGTGRAGDFQVNNSLNSSDAINITTNGTGKALNVTHTGTGATNIAGFFSASGGATNYAIKTEAGNILFNNAHIKSTSTAPPTYTVMAGPSISASSINGTDVKGSVSISSLFNLNEEAIIRVGFTNAYASTPVIVVTPIGTSGHNFSCSVVVGAGNSYFEVYIKNVSSVANIFTGFNYIVIE